MDELELRREILALAARIAVPPAALRPRARFSWWRLGASRGQAPIPTPPSVGRILVVEDDAATREVVSEALTEEGFVVTPAQDGDQALRLALADPPDLIVLDLGLPVVDGPTFAARWRARDGHGGVPILVVSGQADGRTAAAAMRAAAFLRKPLDLGDLADVVRSLLGTPPATFAGVA